MRGRPALLKPAPACPVSHRGGRVLGRIRLPGERPLPFSPQHSRRIAVVVGGGDRARASARWRHLSAPATRPDSRCLELGPGRLNHVNSAAEPSGPTHQRQQQVGLGATQAREPTETSPPLAAADSWSRLLFFTGHDSGPIDHIGRAGVPAECVPCARAGPITAMATCCAENTGVRAWLRPGVC